MPVDLSDDGGSQSIEAAMEDGLDAVRVQLNEMIVSLDSLSQPLAAAHVQMAIDALDNSLD
jgi:hypothetical protein